MNGGADPSQRRFRGRRLGREDAVVGRLDLRAGIPRRELVEVDRAATWTNVGTTQPGGTVTPPPPPPPPTGGPTSADGTVVPPATQIVDALGAVWTMNGGAILRDGVSAAGGAGVTMLWSGGSIYVLGRTGGSLVEVAGRRLDQRRHHAARRHGDAATSATAAGGTTSPDGTVVPPAAQIVDALGAVWTMNGGAILRNGVSAAGGTGVTMLWSSGSIYALSSFGGTWWKWHGSGWTNVGTTQPGARCCRLRLLRRAPRPRTGRWCRRPRRSSMPQGAVWALSGDVILRNGLHAAGGTGFRIVWLPGHRLRPRFRQRALVAVDGVQLGLLRNHAAGPRRGAGYVGGAALERSPAPSHSQGFCPADPARAQSVACFWGDVRRLGSLRRHGIDLAAGTDTGTILTVPTYRRILRSTSRARVSRR